MDNILTMSNITKEFNGVAVLKNVDFELVRGEVHALVGANGAGKSTLMKIINGIYSEYQGTVNLNGKNIRFQSPQDAFNNGVAMIHQELDLVPTMDATSNIYLGRELIRNSRGMVDRHKMREETQKLLNSLGFQIDASARVSTLSAAQQQLLLIARAVSLDAQIIIMDEPTSSLSFDETESLFKIIEDLKNKGKSIIYISHYLEEIFRVADRITVLRNGEKVKTTNVSSTNITDVVYWMIGNSTQMDKKYLRMAGSRPAHLEVMGLTQKRGIVKEATFTLNKGEILGFAGAIGSGRTELAKMIYGAEACSAGEIKLNDAKVKINSPKIAVKNKIAFVPEERKTEGLVLRRSIFDNISLVAFNGCRYGLIKYKPLIKATEQIIKNLSLKCNNQSQMVTALSGGNQQKAILGRWLIVAPDILILDQPTRGVDVGAKKEIYELINDLAENGTSIILISDELEEIINLSDRILVLKKGHIVKEIDNVNRDTSKKDLLQAMVG